MHLPPFLSAALLCCSSLSAQSAAPPLDAASEAKVSSVFAKFDNQDGPGMSVAVYRHGKLAYARGFGLASVEHDVPNTPETVFRIGSTSKQFTAACVIILALVEELSLDDDIRMYLPEMPDYGTPISIQHLLHHTSGIRDYINLASLMGRSIDGMSHEECVAAVARQRGLGFKPGDTFQYSNSNYLLLGEIVRRVSDQSLAEFARENVFEPLGMSSTHFHDRHGHVVKDRALGYSPNGMGELELDLTKNDCVGDGGVFTTVEDMLLWDSNFYDEQLTGGLPFNELMQTPGTLNDGSRLDYASGLILGSYGELPVVMHSGSWVGYLADMIRFPDQELSIICLANRADLNPTELCLKVADMLLGEALAKNPTLITRGDHPELPKPGPFQPMQGKKLKPAELASYAGVFHSNELENDWNISLRGNTLELALPFGEIRSLPQRGVDRFGDARLQLRFLPGEATPTGYVLWMREFGEFEFRRR